MTSDQRSRFTESDLEWAPVLPSHWEKAALKWVAQIYAGGTPDKNNLDYWVDGTIPWLNSGSVNDWSIDSPSSLITIEAFQNSSARWVPAKSVVVGLAGQGKTKGTAARLEISSTTNQSMAAIVPGPKINYRYAHYWLTSNYQSIRNLAGGDKRDGLNLQHVGEIECPIPPKNEQVAIADYLDHEIARIKTLVQKQERLIETLKNRRLSVAEKLILEGSNPLAGSVDKQVEYVSLRFGFDVVLGKMLDAGRDSREGDVMLSYIRAANIQDRGLVLEDVKSMPFSLVEERNLDLRRNDLLVVEGGAIGTCFVLDEDMPGWSFQKTVNRVRAHGPWSTRYLGHCLRIYRDSGILDVICNKSTIPHLTAEKLSALPIPYKPPEDQASIALILDKESARIDALIEKARQMIGIINERRAALITSAVTGQIDVRKEAVGG